jgi:hypothetical protein
VELRPVIGGDRGDTSGVAFDEQGGVGVGHGGLSGWLVSGD